MVLEDGLGVLTFFFCVLLEIFFVELDGWRVLEDVVLVVSNDWCVRLKFFLVLEDVLGVVMEALGVFLKILKLEWSVGNGRLEMVWVV